MQPFFPIILFMILLLYKLIFIYLGESNKIAEKPGDNTYNLNHDDVIIEAERRKREIFSI